MSEILGTYHNGRIELDETVDWPEGSRVRVSAEDGVGAGLEYEWGINPSDYHDTPEFRARLAAQMDSFEPLEFTPAEEAQWQAARQSIKDYTIAAVRKQMGLAP